jgi:hypothetical protein
MSHAGNIVNSYVRSFGPDFDRIPKAVWAAIAIDLTMADGDAAVARGRIMQTWRTLHDNGIVPQKPG